MGLALTRFHKGQQNVYNKAASSTEYTFAELCAFVGEFEADTEVGTPGMIVQFDELFMDFVDGLCLYGYFTPDITYGGDQLDLDDWRFTKVDAPVPPDAPAPTPDWTIPWTVQGNLIVGVAP